MTRTVDILLIEDNEGDILLTREALDHSAMPVTLHVVRDGKSGIDFLTGANGFQDSVEPDIILLDINLPKKNGHEVLGFIRATPELRHIPVIMLTTSSFQKDVSLAYHNHVNCFISKPLNSDTFMEVVTRIHDFWVNVATLPSKSKP